MIFSDEGCTVQYTSVFIMPKYNNILQFNHKAVGVFLSFYIPAYIYIQMP